jgi:hypothetical protein
MATGQLAKCTLACADETMDEVEEMLNTRFGEELERLIDSNFRAVRDESDDQPCTFMVNTMESVYALFVES